MESTGRNIRMALFLKGLFAVFTYLTGILRGGQRKPYGRNRSLIRHVGSVLPMKSLPRFYLGPKVQQSNIGMGDVCIHDCVLEDDSGYIRSYGSNCQQSQLMCSYSFRHSSIRSSTPIEEHNGEILALQKEVQKLQAMVHELWLCHQAGLSSVCEETVIAVSCAIPSASASPAQLLPPPPPPPPPPLPLSLTPVPIVRRKSQATRLCHVDFKDQTIPSLGDILKDIAKVKLRPVERSPGGNPIKRFVTPSKPSTDLAAVLKKRFTAMHNQTPSSYHDSVRNSGNSQFDLDMTETCKLLFT